MVPVTAVLVSTGSLLGGRYRLDDSVGAGGMGEVWRATDLVLDRLVAVKLLHPGYARDEQELARFRAEARHAGSLSHPGIAQVYDYHEADPPAPPYLVMELVDGPSLASLLAEGPVDAARTMGLIAQAAGALQAAHAAGLVHRDIKPGNLLVSRNGQLKITDFGIAHAAGSAPLTRPGALIGTPAYLAPERAAGLPATPAADLYSLGIVAFQCLTGEPPFSGEPLAVALAHQERPLPPMPPSVPAEAAQLVGDLTAKDPGARPATAAEVAERAAHLRTVLTAATTRQRGRQDRRRVRLPAGVAVAAAVAAIAATGWAMTGAHGPASAHSPSSPPASSQASPRGSHPANRVGPGGTGVVSTTKAPAHGRRSKAAHKSSGSNTTANGTLATGGALAAGSTPTPTGTPIATGGATPTGTPTPSGNPTTSGTPATSGAPTPTGTPAPSGSSTSVPSASPASSTATATGSG
jgi:eukaryotic-like serine/threonine-protein kinase